MHGFNEYKLRKNLTVFQEREMKSTVNNYILMIDSVRRSITENYKKEHVEYSEEKVKEATLTFIRTIVHESTYANGAYVWINEVTDYNGGQDYGIRQVHGNFPDTEGMLLSTSMQDAKGNYPYLTELNGIKEYGDITYKYFFEEYKSNVVSEKITYAKLYEPYNWIVCTGTYLNSMYDPAGGLSARNKYQFYILWTVLILLAIILFTYIILQNIANSRKLLRETESLKIEIERDSLTGAASRSFGSNLLKECLNNFQTKGKNYTIAILDIDNFKNFNDSYGHNIGDNVLKNLVGVVKTKQSDGEYIIRWGGDEFILIYNEIKDDADLIMENLIKSVSNESIITDNGEEIHYSISLGVSNFNSNDKTIADTIKRIDDALYLSKRKKNAFYIIR